MPTNIFRLITLSGLLMLLACTPESATDPLSYVDPFIGAGGHGHTFPGATAPFGMVQLSPDTRLEGWDGCSGYHDSDSIVYGFSHTHLSGTGVADYCDILFKPCVGDRYWENGYKEGNGYGSTFRKSSEKASPGFYAVALSEGIEVELTAGPRSGFHRYTFQITENAHLILDLLHRDPLLDGDIRVINDSTLAGSRRSSSWARDQIVYFYAVFSKPWNDMEELRSEEWDFRVKGAMYFDLNEGEQLLLKVGISAVDVEGAKQNLEADIPAWDFDGRKSETEALWLAELNKIEVEGGENEKTIFYTALYHSMIAPNLISDADGRYRKAVPKTASSPYDQTGQLPFGEEQYTIFSLWDTYRATHPLYTIIDRDRSLQYVRTFLRQYKEGGQLPVWELACNFTGCMIGYHSVSVIADAYAKGITDFDTDLAMEAMRHSAEQDHLGLEAYKAQGFISSEDEPESVSKTLEYAYDDWCIAQFAQMAGYEEVYDQYIRRAQNYKNLFDPTDGFIKARYNGGWYTPFRPEEVNFNYTEANGWQYSLAVPHDVGGLIDLMGGKSALERHLDSLFGSSPLLSGRHQSDITGLIGQYAHGNEPSHHMAYLYNATDAPWKTQEYVRRIRSELYAITPDGLSGNEDCGQMSSWYVLSALGIYPMCPGSEFYELTSPLFPKAVIHLESGRDLTITTRGSGPYIQEVLFNGISVEVTSISHEMIMEGGELVFQLNESKGLWDVRTDTYSRISDELIAPVPFIISDQPSFPDSMKITIGAAQGEIFYREAAENTDPESYTEPFFITEDTEMEAYTRLDGDLQSGLVRARFVKIQRDWELKLGTDYAAQYSASGDQALIDGIRGGNDFRTGGWQGFQGEDLVLEIDLGKEENIRSVSLSCIQDVNSWIWLPPSVVISGWNTVGEKVWERELRHAVPDDLYGSILHEFMAEVPFEKTRFIKVEAENYGVCPEWHLGAGGRAWIFADEVILK